MKNRSVSDFVSASMDAILKSEAHKSLFNTQYKFASKDSMCAKHGKMDSCSSSSDESSADTGLSGAPGDPLDPDLYNGPRETDPHFLSKQPASSYKGIDVPYTDVEPSFPKADPSSNGLPPDYGRDWLESQLVNNVRETATGGKFQSPQAPRPSGQNEADDASADDDNDAKKKKKFNFEKKKDDSGSSSSKSDSSSADDESYADDSDSSDEEKSSMAFNTAIDSLLTASAALDYVGLGRSSSLSLKLASLVVQAKKKVIKKDPKKSDSNSAKDKAAKEKAAKDKEKEKLAKEKEKEKAAKEKEKEKIQKEKDKEKAAKEKEKAAKEKAKSSSSSKK